MKKGLLLAVLSILLASNVSSVELRVQSPDTSDLVTDIQVAVNIPEIIDAKTIVFRLEFNPAVLQVTGNEGGAFLNVSGQKELFAYDNTEGTATFAKSLSSGSAETSGDAVRIIFSPVTSGTSMLEIQKSLLGLESQTINVTEYKDVITIGDGLIGDLDNNQEVSLSEVIDYINLWSQDQVTLSGVIDVISNWAS